MEAFSGLLLGLYRQAQVIPPTEFQMQALDTVREALVFDSALWATGVIEPESATPHAIFVYRQPPDMMENWGRIKPRDTLIFEAFNNLGRTVNAALSSDPSWQARFKPWYVPSFVDSYCCRFEVAASNSTGLTPPR